MRVIVEYYAPNGDKEQVEGENGEVTIPAGSAVIRVSPVLEPGQSAPAVEMVPVTLNEDGGYEVGAPA